MTQNAGSAPMITTIPPFVLTPLTPVASPNSTRVSINEERNLIHAIPTTNGNLETIGVTFRTKKRGQPMPKIMAVLKRINEVLNTHGNKAMIYSHKVPGKSFSEMPSQPHLISEFFESKTIANQNHTQYMKIVIASDRKLEVMKPLLVPMLKDIPDMEIYLTDDNFWTGSIVEAGAISGLHPTHTNRKLLLEKLYVAMSDHLSNDDDTISRHSSIWDSIQSTIKKKPGVPPLQLIVRGNIVHGFEGNKVESGPIVSVICDVIALEIVRNMLDDLLLSDPNLIPGGVFISPSMLHTLETRNQYRSLLRQHQYMNETSRFIRILYLNHDSLEVSTTVQIGEHQEDRSIKSILLSKELGLFTAIEPTTDPTCSFLITNKANHDNARTWCADQMRTLFQTAIPTNLKKFSGKFETPILPSNVYLEVRRNKERQARISTTIPTAFTPPSRTSNRRPAWKNQPIPAVNWVDRTPQNGTSQASPEEFSRTSNDEEIKSLRSQLAEAKEDKLSQTQDMVSRMSDTESRVTTMIEEMKEEFREQKQKDREQKQQDDERQMKAFAALFQKISEVQNGHSDMQVDHDEQKQARIEQDIRDAEARREKKREEREKAEASENARRQDQRDNENKVNTTLMTTAFAELMQNMISDFRTRTSEYNTQHNDSQMQKSPITEQPSLDEHSDTSTPPKLLFPSLSGNKRLPENNTPPASPSNSIFLTQDPNEFINGESNGIPGFGDDYSNSDATSEEGTASAEANLSIMSIDSIISTNNEQQPPTPEQEFTTVKSKKSKKKKQKKKRKKTNKTRGRETSNPIPMSQSKAYGGI
jgi:hypothetical protein